ncbi:unnamed protein product, partial [Effrenium voratum]
RGGAPGANPRAGDAVRHSSEAAELPAHRLPDPRGRARPRHPRRGERGAAGPGAGHRGAAPPEFHREAPQARRLPL